MKLWHSFTCIKHHSKYSDMKQPSYVYGIYVLGIGQCVDSLSLPQGVWGLSWDDLRAGSDLMVRSGNYMKASSRMCDAILARVPE